MIYERFKRINEQKGVIVPVHKQILGEVPEIDFSTLIDYYLKDATVKAAIDWLTDQVSGPGFYTTSESERAKNLVDEFNEGVNLDNFIRIWCQEILITGNSFTELITPTKLEDLHHIQLSTVKRIKRDRFGRVEAIIINVSGEEIELNPKNVIHFAWNVIDRQAFGIGLIHALASMRIDSSGNMIPPILNILSDLEQDMRRLLHTHGEHVIYEFPDASDDFIENKAKPIIKGLKPGDKFITNKTVNIKAIEIDPRVRFEAYIDYFTNLRIIGLNAAIVKLVSTPGFTEASARAALEAVESTVRGIQRFLKRIIEREIFDRVLISNGINPQRNPVRLNWGQPDIPEIKFDDVFKAVELGIVRVEEARKILQKSGWELWEPASTISTTTPVTVEVNTMGGGG
ncbi:MAG: hypothetical protein N3F06_02880 [Nitrososphaerales archaeon]|nr:hypothetical protein [Nitrososphaerales archaeon]